jgi:hypothetical protein
MNTLSNYSYNPTTTNISKQFVYGFQTDANRYWGEFAYVFNDTNGEYKTIQHTQSTETSVTYDTKEVSNAFQQINTSSTDASARQWHRHPNTVNGVLQWENKYLLSQADRESMKQRFIASPIKQDIYETLAIDAGNWETHAITYTYNGNNFSIGESTFGKVKTNPAKPVLRIQHGIAQAFQPDWAIA